MIESLLGHSKEVREKELPALVDTPAFKTYWPWVWRIVLALIVGFVVRGAWTANKSHKVKTVEQQAPAAVVATPPIASNPIVQKCKSTPKTSKKKPVDAAKIEVAKVTPAVVLPEQKQAAPINYADHDLSLKPPSPPFPPN